MIKHVLLILLLIVMLVSPIQVHAGSFGDKGTPGVPGQWYIGESPESINPTKAPLIFIHGLNSSSRTWWEGNDMYQVALQDGYETAFVDLHGTEDMWTNGALLAAKLAEIHQYFGKDLVLVTHSKGGIDTQSALVHHGAHAYVSNVITLSTPHYGSQLADLAYSSWAGWLAGIIGGRNAATNSLQTGYMAFFRSETDHHPNARINPFFTLAGTSWGSFGSSLYWGGVYLSSYGQNDGAVTVANSRLPYSRELAVGRWNHTTVKEGHATFTTFKPYLTSEKSLFSMTANEDIPSKQEASSQIVRGGPLQAFGKTDSFHIEEDVTSVTIDFLSDEHFSAATLHGPNGEVIPANISYSNDEIFEGAYHHLYKLNQPSPGEWHIQTNHAKGSAYLVTASIDSPYDKAVTLEITGAAKQKIAIKDNLQPPPSKKTTYRAEATYTDKHGKQKSRSVPVTINSAGELSIPLKKEGIYTLTIDMESETKKGYPFERTLIKSVYVDQNGKLYE
ncbi:hypothetical protein BpOF4_18780 [Alkalihalophilus pseudofirmus OF4]|uniref:Lipase n=1 Tax=Alkalihalophilus pseudofirmus (strain ATCC BAA-2126 / JCM 17055 / OF4) TaxID=398511 RepID=D3FST0_ALKPO|nr:hypothetical protein [Alkalihalophilus pseudofirmus]ADC51795.1 hypothetical protein BpOF4_18780 [Alkalihalophilus pseudofirmus OF4]